MPSIASVTDGVARSRYTHYTFNQLRTCGSLDIVVDTSHPATALLDRGGTHRLILGQIAGKWSILILTVVCVEPTRFNAIKRRLHGITHKALTDALRRLERNGLIARRILSTSSLGVEYSITPLGRSLQEPCVALAAWADAHSNAVMAAQLVYDDARAAD